MNRYSMRALVLGIGLVLASVWMVGEAQAGPFDGKIVMSKKRIPQSAKSEKAYYDTLRKMNTDKFMEDKANKEWKIYIAAFFKKPLNDLEVTVKIYDLTEGQKHLRSSFEQYLDARGQKSITSYIKLDREQFGVNRQMLLTVENRGQVLASGKFQILGEAEKYSGKVDFSEEETQGQ